jgi:small subunit ribosomal protein S5
VVKGGRRFSFGALVAVGNHHGQIGIGYGKANEVPASVDKAVKDARKKMIEVPLVKGTIPHRVEGRFGATRVLMIPAAGGTGVIASTAVRTVLTLAGVENVLTKVLGSKNQRNVLKATMAGLSKLRSKEEVQELRGVNL